MKILSITRLIIVGFVLFAGGTNAIGQSRDWKTFEATVFQVADAVVRGVAMGDVTEGEMASLRNDAAQLEMRFASYAQQCPSPEACQTLQYILLRIKEVADLTPGGVFSVEQGEKIAFLRQAVHSYRNAAPQQTSPVVPVAYSPQDQLQIKIVYGYRPGGRGKPQPLTNGGTMHTGDHYKIIFQPLENYYVYIFQSDSSGKIYGLFPLKNFRGVAVDLRNPVQAGKTYFVPAEDKSFALDDQRGLEQIYFLAFRQPDQQLEQLYQQVVEAQNRDTSGQIQAIRTQFLIKIQEKGPAVIVNDPTEAGKVIWQEDGQLFSVLRQRLEGMCDGCVNVLRFIHQ